MYDIGEEVIVVKKFSITNIYLKKGEVTYIDLNIATVTFSDDVVSPEGNKINTATFFHASLANAKEFLQLQLEGKIEYV